MFIQPIDYFLAAWFVLALGSTPYVAWDQHRNNPESRPLAAALPHRAPHDQ